MKLWYRVICVAGLLTFCVGAGADNAKNPKKAKGDLDGEWRLTTIVVNDSGVTSRIDVLGDVLRMKFAGDKATVRSKNQNDTKWKSENRTVTLDVDKTPKQIDIVDARKKAGMYGIYKVEGDLFTLCYVNSPAKDRPEKFQADGKKVHMQLYRRVKD